MTDSHEDTMTSSSEYATAVSIEEGAAAVAAAATTEPGAGNAG